MEICMVPDTKNDKNQQPAEEIRGTTLLLEMEYADESIGSSGTAFFVADDKIAMNCHLLLEATEGTLIGFLNRGKRIWFKAPVRP